jgi:hypothetical protein
MSGESNKNKASNDTEARTNRPQTFRRSPPERLDKPFPHLHTMCITTVGPILSPEGAETGRTGISGQQGFRHAFRRRVPVRSFRRDGRAL